MEDFIRGLPKCELHMHLFGNLEPEIVFKLAKRNSISLPYQSVDGLKKAYNFQNLDEFLLLFKVCLQVIKKPEDFYDVLYDYLNRCSKDNVRYAEIYFGTTLFLTVKISPTETMDAIVRAITDGYNNFNVKSKIILGLNRTAGEEVAFEHLNMFLDYLDLNKAEIKRFDIHNKPIIATGLCCSERDYPPSIYEHFYEHTRKIGLKSTIHAGEEGPSEYIRQSIDILKADRIDHGVTATDEMIARLAKEKVPVTTCPISNLKLKVIDDIKNHPLKKQLEAGVIVSIHSDDPSYFGGYINENYIDAQKALNLSRDQIITIAKNSYISSFISEEEKQEGIKEIDDYVRKFDANHH